MPGMYMDTLNGKVAFITGGASGIGLGMAKAFVGEGMNVVIADIWQDHLDEALEHFRETNHEGQVHAIRLDVSDRPAYERAAAETLERFGKLHVLCNNAGLGAGMRLKNTTYQDWDWAMGVMVGGAVNGVVNFLPRMIEHGEGGHIVNTSSMSGVLQPAMMGGETYTTGKMAMIGMLEQGRLDLAEDRIGCSILIPGPIQSNIFKIGRTRPDRFKNEAAADVGGAARAARADMGANPLWMKPERVGEMVVEGIRKNALYIFTHSMFRAGMQEKFQKMLDALPAEPDSQELIDSLGMFLHNPIYASGPDAK